MHTQKSTDGLEKDFFIEDGKLFRIYRGKVIQPGYFDKSSGYWKIKYRGKNWLLHRLVFLLTRGWLPDFVDHENRDVHDNNPDNLRACDYKGSNTINSEIRSDNTSGYKGVTWHKTSKKWHSSVFHKGKRYYLGVFENKEDAALAYNKKAQELFGDFPVLNEVDNG